jgi:polyhydroxybutyrate depolymerase
MPRRRPILFTIASIIASIIAVIVLLLSLAGHRLFRASADDSNHHGTIESDGRTREYYVHTPPGYTGKTPLPMVLVLHGAIQTPEGVEKMSAMSAKADAQNFLAVYPQGTGHVDTWNAGACCGYAMKNNVDDMAFFRALIDKLEKDYSVDPKRIYSTGISNGAMMSYRLACELSEKIAAIAPVEGSQDIPCTPKSPVSVIVFHGTADRLVPFNGGTTPYQAGSKRSDTSVADTVAFWVKYDGCSPTPQHEQTAELHTDIYTGCRAGSGVALYAIQGGHHIWPGVRFSQNNVPATDLIWEFFASHPKQ